MARAASQDAEKDLRPWLESLRLMAREMGPRRSFQTSLTSLLRILASRHDFLRPHLVLFDPETGTLRLSMAEAQPREHHENYTPGVGVTGQVFATGRPVIVEKMKGDALFLSLLFERSEEEMEHLAFLSVPVLAPAGENAAAEVIGTLNADTPTATPEDLQLRSLFLQTVAALIASEAAYLQDELVRQRSLSTKLPHEYEGEASSAPVVFAGPSKVMRHILEQAAQFARGRAPVLLLGEAGVGRERLAAYIHEIGDRSDLPMVVCHCAALAPERLQAELCGYQKGAFLGAMQTQKGLFEQANMGTLFLDAVDALPRKAQESLLLLIKERQVLRQGASEPVRANVRVIASSSAPLDKLVENAIFSGELYSRLSVCSLRIPPLRERREDIVPLVEYFLRKNAEKQGEKVKRISYPALELLTRYPWPGNTAELIRCVEDAATNCENCVIRAADLPPALQTAESSSTETELPLGDAVARFEKELLVDALIKASGNMLKAARNLKTSYRIVNYKVKKYGIDPHQFAYRIK